MNKRDGDKTDNFKSNISDAIYDYQVGINLLANVMTSVDVRMRHAKSLRDIMAGSGSPQDKLDKIESYLSNKTKVTFFQSIILRVSLSSAMKRYRNSHRAALTTHIDYKAETSAERSKFSSKEGRLPALEVSANPEAVPERFLQGDVNTIREIQGNLAKIWKIVTTPKENLSVNGGTLGADLKTYSEYLRSVDLMVRGAVYRGINEKWNEAVNSAEWKEAEWTGLWPQQHQTIKNLIEQYNTRMKELVSEGRVGDVNENELLVEAPPVPARVATVVDVPASQSPPIESIPGSVDVAASQLPPVPARPAKVDVPESQSPPIESIPGSVDVAASQLPPVPPRPAKVNVAEAQPPLQETPVKGGPPQKGLPPSPVSRTSAMSPQSLLQRDSKPSVKGDLVSTGTLEAPPKKALPPSPAVRTSGVPPKSPLTDVPVNATRGGGLGSGGVPAHLKNKALPPLKPGAGKTDSADEDENHHQHKNQKGRF